MKLSIRNIAGFACLLCVICQDISMAVPKRNTATKTDLELKGLVDGLGSPDGDMRERSEGAIDLVNFDDIPALKKLADANDLGPEARLRLDRALKNLLRRHDVWLKNLQAEKPVFEWAEKIALADYDRDGHTDPKWDAMARKGISAAWRRGTIPDSVSIASCLKEATEQLHAAIAAGCDDPTVLVSAGMTAQAADADPDTVFAYFLKASAIAKADLPSPYFKILIDDHVLRQYKAGYDGGLVAQNTKKIELLYNDMDAAFKVLAQSPQVPVQALVETCELAKNDAEIMGFSSKDIFDDIFPPLELVAPADERVIRLKGQFYIAMAWEARGGGYANTVTPQGAQLFADRLAVANELLTKSWQLDPTDPVPPTQMIKVEMGQGKGKDVMELWFKRAMEADPDNWNACFAKLIYLKPKWYGSPKEMLDFGRELLLGQNFYANLPGFLVDAHAEIATLTGNPIRYYSDPNVWAEINEVYIAEMKRYPDDTERRNHYARFACNARRWSVANEQFDKLGDKADPHVFGGQTVLDRLKSIAKTEAARDPNTP